MANRNPCLKVMVSGISDPPGRSEGLARVISDGRTAAILAIVAVLCFWTGQWYGLVTVRGLSANAIGRSTIFIGAALEVIIFGKAVQGGSKVALAQCALGWLWTLPSFAIAWWVLRCAHGVRVGDLVFGGGVGGLYFLAMAKARTADHKSIIDLVVLFEFLVMIMTPIGAVLLKQTIVSHPTTYDATTNAMDAALVGFSASLSLMEEVRQHVFLWNVLWCVYASLPLAVVAMVILLIRHADSHRVGVFRIWVVSVFLAFACYNLVPVTGPVFAFPHGMETFGAQRGATTRRLLVPAFVKAPRYGVAGNAYRNGVPSMHVAWALMLWFASLCIPAGGVRKAYGLYAVLTCVAVIGLGEHYLVDMVAAVPTATGMFLAFSGEPNRRRRNAVITCGVLLLSWVVAVRQGGFFMGHAGWCIPILAVVTLIECVLLIVNFRPWAPSFTTPPKPVWTNPRYDRVDLI